MKILLLVLVWLLHNTTEGASITGSSENAAAGTHDVEKREAFDMLDFLQTYGYLEGSAPSDGGYRMLDSKYALEDGLRRYQAFNGLPVTGTMDKETKKKMQSPRCGFPDILKNSDPSQPQRYTHLDSKWDKNMITWKSAQYTNQLSHSQQRQALSKALKYWSDVTPLTFQHTDGTPDIEVKFARGEHGDGKKNAFDGRGKVLAHASGPGNQPISGDTHFDDDEQWTLYDKSRKGTDLETVAAHEFGHALGLGHSSVRGALMAPYYQGYNPDFKLSHDDIRGIQALYGSNPRSADTTTKAPDTTTALPTRRPNPPTTRPTYCSMKLDAVTMGSDNITYGFSRGLIYALSKDRRITESYPKRIREVYPRAPGRIRAAVYVPEHKHTYIFKRNMVWRYTDFSLDNDFPRVIDTSDYPERFPHAAISITDDRGNNRVFMFGKKKFWEWSPITLRMVPGYAFDIGRYWRGIPEGVEAAVTVNDGSIFFFKGLKYRMFDPVNRAVQRGYPKMWAPDWFGEVCESRSLSPFSDEEFRFENLPLEDTDMKLSYPLTDLISDDREVYNHA